MYKGRVEGIVTGGAGIIRHEGKSVFIESTAPGDLAVFRIKNDHRSWAEGELLELLEKSPLRTEPVCPLYGSCGGCSLQHLGYESQITAKAGILKDTFARIGGINSLPEIRIRRSAPYGYRNRFRFHTAGEGIGFKKRKSSGIAVAADCPVAEKGIRNALKEGELLPPPGRTSFSVYSRGKTFLCEGCTEKGSVSILGKELAMDVKVFFQSNAEMLELLITDLLAAASDADRNFPMADVYCGVGTFASFLGEGPPTGIDLVEANKAALGIAKENMPPGCNVRYHALSDTDWVKSLAGKPRAKGKSWGFMVLDPPREGLSRLFREWLALNGPELAAYVSCDPATLARDSKILVNGAYSLKELAMYDFYPQTGHIESLALFNRK